MVYLVYLANQAQECVVLRERLTKERTFRQKIRNHLIQQRVRIPSESCASEQLSDNTDQSKSVIEASVNPISHPFLSLPSNNI